MYADKVVSIGHVGWCSGSRLPKALKNLKFPRLKSIEIFGGCYDNASAYSSDNDDVFTWESVPYFMRTIKHIRIVNVVHFDLPLLEGIRKYCPDLVEFQAFWLDQNHLSSVLAYIKHWPKLKLLELQPYGRNVVRNGHLATLMGMNLEVLLLHPDSPITYSIGSALDQTSSRFVALRDLDIALKYTDIPFLPVAAPMLQKLNVAVYDNGEHDSVSNHKVLEYLVPLHRLQDLVVVNPRRYKLGKHELFQITKFPQLRRLGISLFDPDDKAEMASEITDDVIEELVSSLRDYEAFDLALKCDLTIYSVIIIGRNCPRLLDLRLNGYFDLSSLAYSSAQSFPLFPRLQSLRLDGPPVLRPHRRCAFESYDDNLERVF